MRVFCCEPLNINVLAVFNQRDIYNLIKYLK